MGASGVADRFYKTDIISASNSVTKDKSTYLRSATELSDDLCDKSRFRVGIWQTTFKQRLVRHKEFAVPVAWTAYLEFLP